MAWDLLFGFAGEVNFGPTFLIGTGAYTAGILNNLYQLPIWVCLIAGALGLGQAQPTQEARTSRLPAEIAEHQDEYGFIGRDYPILQMERALHIREEVDRPSPMLL